MTTQRWKRFALACIAIVALGCEGKPTTDAPKPQTNNTTSDDANSKTNNQKEAPIAEEKPKVEPRFTKPIDLGLSLADIEKREPIGTISGEIFGETQPIVALSRVSCGDGTVLQAVFKSPKGIRISPPMPTQFLNLATKKPVTYKEGEFDVTVNFEEDKPDKLKGSLKIEYMEAGIQKTFAQITVDGAPISQLFEPKLDGKGKLPKYDGCVPSGYFKLKVKGKDPIHGYVHTTNVGGFGVPKIRIPLNESEGFEALIVPLEKGQTLENAKVVMQTSRKKGENPAVINMEAYRVPELGPPDQATSFNLGRVTIEGIYSGTAEVSLDKKTIALKVDNFETGETLESSWDELEIESLQVSSGLVPEKAMSFTLPSPPVWWPATK